MLAASLSGAVPARAGSSSTAVPPRAHAPVARATAPPATTTEYWFTGAQVIFQRAEMHDGGELAVASDDLGFGRLLTKTGATISYDPGQRYVIIGTADRRDVSFTLGDPRYTIGDVGETAPFAPYAKGGVAYLPLSALLLALHVAPVESLKQTILQPQLVGIDVQSTALTTIVTLHSATPIRFKRVSDPDDDHLTLALLGVGTHLPVDRPVSGVGLSGISVAAGGTPRNPTVVLSFANSAGASYVLVPSKSPNDLTLAFAPEGTTLGGTAVPASGYAADVTLPLAVHAARTYVPPAPPVPPAAVKTAVPVAPTDAPADAAPGAVPPASGVPATSSSAPPAGAPALSPSPAAASVTSVDYAPDGLGLNVDVGMRGGPVPFEFHRLPDDRWYLDLRGAALETAPRDETVESAAVSAIRVKQLSAGGVPYTRIALTLATPRIVTLKATPGGFSIAVDALDDLEPRTVGQGSIGANVLAFGNAAPTALAPPQLSEIPDPGATPWKFAPSMNGDGRLIVIDPGHGGSDDGAAHNGMKEKDLTLDMARRLRTVLVAHGWQVKMTRDSDVDVFGVDASAHDELQARCDVANQAGAHLFVSIHVNSFTSAELNGTTTYYYNGFSLPLAQSVHRRLMAADLETKNDGVRRENFYVIHHTTMPSILVETAFVSNPSDAELLRSPLGDKKWRTGSPPASATTTPRIPPARRAPATPRVNNILAIFDSGLGGLTVLRALRERLPTIDLLYFADQANVPYGDRTPENLHALMERNVRSLEVLGATAIVMGCNTSCAVAATYGWPQTRLPVLDLIESAAAAVAATAARRIGVLATRATAASNAYGRAIRAASPDATVIEIGDNTLVPLVESADLESEKAEAAVRAALSPFPPDLDTLILACTHFPMLAGIFTRNLPPEVTTLDPATSQATRAASLAATLDRTRGGTKTTYITTADPAHFERSLTSIDALSPRDTVRTIATPTPAQ